METEHLHRYRRINLIPRHRRTPERKEYLVYQCLDCPHYVALNLSVGRECACHRCGKETRIAKYHVIRKILHPTCESCRRDKKETVVTDEFFSELTNGNRGESE